MGDLRWLGSCYVYKVTRLGIVCLRLTPSGKA